VEVGPFFVTGPTVANMNAELKLGNRVRVCRPSAGYHVGDKGTVLEGPASNTRDDQKCYVVAMDKDGPGRTSIIFGADEIEPDD